MLRVTSITKNAIPALVNGSPRKTMSAARKMALPQEVNMLRVANSGSDDVTKTKFSIWDLFECGSVETFCTAGLNF